MKAQNVSENTEYHNGTQQYFTQIGKFPLFTAEEELEAFITYERLKENYLQLKQESKNAYGSTAKVIQKALKTSKRQFDKHEQNIIKANLRLVPYIAKKLPANSQISIDDLIQEGNMGLMQAVRNFKHQEGCRFATYAHYSIYQSMSRFISHKAPLITIPLHVNERRTKVQKYLNQHLEADNSSISDALNISDKHLRDLEGLPLFQQSLNTPHYEDSTETLLDQIPDQQSPNPAEATTQSDFFEMLSLSLDTLTEQERYIITKRFGLNNEIPQTLQQISLYFKCSRERVRQIEYAALSSIRKRLNEKEYAAQ